MKVKLICGPGVPFSDTGDDKLREYIERIYDVYGSNVLQQNLVLSGNGTLYPYFTVKDDGGNNNID